MGQSITNGGIPPCRIIPALTENNIRIEIGKVRISDVWTDFSTQMISDITIIDNNASWLRWIFGRICN